MKDRIGQAIQGILPITTKIVNELLWCFWTSETSH